ncbi:MAG: hypothetical protein H6670_16110 [Anaerolineaceae bacterium]|nr:hypothetical protein [Anaerolineaceae bacterium]
MDSTLDTVDANPGDGLCADANGQCTLRTAIIESNAMPFGQSVYLPEGTYTLTIPGADEDESYTGDLDIQDQLTLYGDGMSKTIIDGGNLDRVLHYRQSIYYLENEHDLPAILSGVTVQGGSAPFAGGIYNEKGYLEITYARLTNNNVYGSHPCNPAAGAALFFGDRVDIEHSIIDGNTTLSVDLSTHFGVFAGSRLPLSTFSSSPGLNLISTEVINNATDWVFSLMASDCGGSSPIAQMTWSAVTDNTGGGILAYGAYVNINGTTIGRNQIGIRVVPKLNPEDPQSIPSTIYMNGGQILDNTHIGYEIVSSGGSWFYGALIAGNTINCSFPAGVKINGYDGIYQDDSCVLVQPERNTFDSNPAYSYTDPNPPENPIVEYQQSSLYHDNPNGSYGIQPYLTSDLYVFFSEPMFNPFGNDDPHDITNPANHYLVQKGPNNVYDFATCNSELGDDVVIPIQSIEYQAVLSAPIELRERNNVAHIRFAPSDTPTGFLPSGHYRYMACGSLHDEDGVALDGNKDGVPGDDYVWSILGTSLPPVSPRVIALAYDPKDDGYHTAWPAADNVIASQVSHFTVDVFTEGAFNPYELPNPNNFMLAQAGPDGTFQTTDCSAPNGDDIAFEVSNVVGYLVTNQVLPVPEPINAAQVYISQPLSDGHYRFIMCDALHDLEGVQIDGDEDGVPGGNTIRDFWIYQNIAIPAPPTLNTLTSTTITLNVEHPDLPFEASVLVYKRTPSGSFIGAITVPEDASTVFDWGLECNSVYRYSYRLQIENATGPVNRSDYSEEVPFRMAPCDPVLRHTFGLYDRGHWLFFDVDGDQRQDIRFNLGPQEPGWIALIGDWNGDGLTGLGLYKDGTFILRSLTEAGTEDTQFVYSPVEGGQPIVGDWNADGTDTIGIYSDGTYYLRNVNSEGPADTVVNLSDFDPGAPTDVIPLSGDWRGVGIDRVGYYRHGTFGLNWNYRETDLMTAEFGPEEGWLPIIGDWEDDGMDTVGLYKDGIWRLSTANELARVDYGFTYGDLSNHWQPLSFDGDVAILNRFFSETVPQPRVTSIPRSDMTPIPTITPTPTPTLEPSECDMSSVKVEFVTFDPLGDVRLVVLNYRSVVSNLVDFNIVWPAVPGLRLQQVVVGGQSANDLPPNGTGTIVWQNLPGGDTSPPTQGINPADGVWLMDYVFPPLSATYIHLDFTGMGAPSLDTFGVELADFAGTWFDISCGPDTDGDGNRGSDQPVSRIMLPTSNEAHTSTPPASLTPAPTRTLEISLTPSVTFTPSPTIPTWTPFLSPTPSPGYTPPTSTLTPTPSDTPEAVITPPTATLTSTPSDTPEPTWTIVTPTPRSTNAPYFTPTQKP